MKGVQLHYGWDSHIRLKKLSIVNVELNYVCFNTHEWALVSNALINLRRTIALLYYLTMFKVPNQVVF